MFYLILFLIFFFSKSDSTNQSNQTTFQILLNNRYNLQYDQTLYLGTPQQAMTMIFNTAFAWIQIPSSNCTNCVESTRFTCSSSSTCLENTTDIILKDLAICHTINDNLYFSSTTNVENQTMLLILKDLSDSDTEGVMGLGLEKILLNDSESILISLKNQGMIEKNIFAFYLSNSIFSSTISSELMIGGYNSDYMQTELTYFPLCSNETWGFNASNFSLDGYVIENDTKNVYINSALNVIIAPFKDYVTILNYLKQNYEACITFGDLIRCACPSGMSNFSSFKFFIEEIEFKMEPEYFITEENSVCSLKISSGNSGEEFWVLGIGFLQKYYMVFDAEDMRIGLAEAVISDMQLDLVYEDTILVGTILLAAFFIGLIVIWIIERSTKFNELDNRVRQFSY